MDSTIGFLFIMLSGLMVLQNGVYGGVGISLFQDSNIRIRILL